MSASLGEYIGFFLFGNVSSFSIAAAYVSRYCTAGAVTVITIIGRKRADHEILDLNCSSLLANNSARGFLPNFVSTLTNFIRGIRELREIPGQSEFKSLIKTSIFIFITAESFCIVSAETVGLVLNNYTILVSLPVGIFIGALAIVLAASVKQYFKIR
jgi:hypothetical protein